MFPPLLPPDMFWFIQSMKLLMRANTVYLVVLHILCPQLTAPRSTHLPFSLQTKGPPLSPWQPPGWFFFPLPAQSILVLSTGRRLPFLFLHRASDTTGSIPCWRMLAAGPPPTVLPQPVEKLFFCKIVNLSVKGMVVPEELKSEWFKLESNMVLAFSPFKFLLQCITFYIKGTVLVNTLKERGKYHFI